MRVYIPNQSDTLLDKALKELELFKQQVMYNHDFSIKDLDKIINLLKPNENFTQVVIQLEQTYHVLKVETNLLIVDRLKNAMKTLNTMRN